MNKINLSVALFILCIITACGIQMTQGGDGGATETVNARVIISDSTVEVTVISDTTVFADVMIFDEKYNPVTKTGYCDSAVGIRADSGIAFDKLSGTYNIIINNHPSQTQLSFNGIIAGSSKTDTLSDTLNTPGSIEGTVSFNKQSGIEKPSVMVFLSGTSFYTEADSMGRFQLQGIPDGEYFIKAVMFSDSKDSSGKSVGKNIEVRSSMKINSITLFFSE